MTRFVCIWILVLIASEFTAFAGETLSIGKILEDPQKYQLHEVSLKGKVKNFRAIEEPFFSGVICYRAYTFTMEERTTRQAIVSKMRILK